MSYTSLNISNNKNRKHNDIDKPGTACLHNRVYIAIVCAIIIIKKLQDFESTWRVDRKIRHKYNKLDISLSLSLSLIIFFIKLYDTRMMKSLFINNLRNLFAKIKTEKRSIIDDLLCSNFFIISSFCDH